MMTTTQYTYDKHFAARLISGEDEFTVTIPDQVAEDQRRFDANKTTFPARYVDGIETMVRLDGDAYDLWGPGTGDTIVREVEA